MDMNHWWVSNGVSINLETGGGVIAGAAGTCACQRHAPARGDMLPLNILKSRPPFPAIWDVFWAPIWMIWLNLLVPLVQDFKHLNHCILTLSQPKGNLWAYFEYFLYWYFSSGTANGGRTPATPYAGYAAGLSTVCVSFVGVLIPGTPLLFVRSDEWGGQWKWHYLPTLFKTPTH